MSDALELYELFQRACALDDERRASLLMELRGRSPERADALQRLIDEDARSGPLPEDPPAVPPRVDATGEASGEAESGGASNAREAHPTEDVLARLVERERSVQRYQPLEEVGSGGQGTVHRVWDEDLRRDLAMKVLRKAADLHAEAGTADRNSLGRFLEEAQITGQLDHPGIVPVHELGLNSEGKLYFTMKLVKGENLHVVFEKVRAGVDGWTRTRVLGVLLRVCEAMSYAHAKNVIHRDLKPTNVMVGRFGEVYVMDWGVARVLGETDGRDLRVQGQRAEIVSGVRGPESGVDLKTLDGHVVGTPAYMSPEQALGQQDRVGPHSDVYSAGALLYELLSGRMPYSEPGRSLPGHAIWYQVQKGPPTALAKVAPKAPEELVAICERAMARKPEERYRDMSELASDLSAYLEHRVVSAYEAGAIPQLRKWVERNMALATAVAGVFLALLIGFATTLSMKLEADRNADLADERRLQAEARRDEVLRLSALQDVEDLVEEAALLWPVLSSDVPRYEAWIDEATQLVRNLPSHEEKRRELQAAELTAGEERWWYNQLSKLIDELEALERGLLGPGQSIAGGGGWTMTYRLELARRLKGLHAPGGTCYERWEETLPDIRAAYAALGVELEIGMQEGLLPMGPDPDSGLWEFADLQTGFAELRNAAGFLEATERSGVVFVLLPGGKYLKGAQNGNPNAPNYDRLAQAHEKPPVEVELAPFFLSKFELTQAQWLGFTGANPSEYQTPHELAPVLTHPVEQVSWTEGRKQLRRMGFELPSEAQWEYAARAGTDTVWWTGSDKRSIAEISAANLADRSAAEHGATWPELGRMKWLDDGYAFHAPVGSFTPNPFGLHDMIGNLWEWCADAFNASTGERTMRGGGFRHDIRRARVAHRSWAVPGFSGSYLGLRPARKIESANGR